MFTAIFSTDNLEIKFSLEEIERVIYRVERIVIMPKYEQWLRREAFVRTAYSSTMVEDATITKKEMEDAVKQAPLSDKPAQRPDIANYGSALEFVDFIGDDKSISIDEAVIRQIHWHLMKGIKDHRMSPGQYRTEPNWIEERGVRVYEPPFHVDIPFLMHDFSDWLKSDSELHPVLKAGIAHAGLVSIHPFVDGNGRTARLLSTLLLQRYGYSFRKLLTIDNYYQRNRDDYIDALRKSIGIKYAADCDLTPWLSFFALSVLTEASELESNMTGWRMAIDKIHSAWKPLGISDRQIDGLIYAERMGSISRKDYMEIAEVSPITAMRDLAGLAERKLLTVKGASRNRRYYPVMNRITGGGKEGGQKPLI